MRRGSDYHIHTFYQRCGNETMTVPNVIRKAEELGLSSIAITDHLNGYDRLDAFRYIKSDIDAVKTEIDVFFGVELNYLSCDGEFAYSGKIHEEFGFEVVIGGIHSAYTDSDDTEEVLGIQHRHFMKTMENPLVDVLVHPFWFPRTEVDSRPPGFWENLILSIPDDHIREWAGASRENRCAIEVNVAGIFYNPAYTGRFKEAYIGLLARLKENGALFSVGSDAHYIGRLGSSDYAEGLLAGMGAGEEQLWAPSRQGRGGQIEV